MPLPLLAMGIGAGMGALSHAFGGNQPQRNVSTIDQPSQDYIMYRRNLAQNMIGQGMPQLDPALLAATQGYGGYAADSSSSGWGPWWTPALSPVVGGY